MAEPYKRLSGDALERLMKDILKNPLKYREAEIINVLEQNDPNGDYRDMKRADLLKALRSQM